jgi:hypothetical protein
METFLMIALALSLAYNLVQGFMLARMASWLREDKAPF